ncbi:MAG: sulfatase-like hydrolase/transferase, partial [Planctomycetota bacterium]
MLAALAACGAKPEAPSDPTPDWFAPSLERWTHGGVTAAGLRLGPGDEDGFEVEVYPGAALRLQLLSTARGAGRLRVVVDGELLAEHDLDGTEWLAPLTVTLDPAQQAGPVDVLLTRQGGTGDLYVLDPRVGPAEIGTPGERPWGPAPPNALIFLADTLRADALGAYGSELGLTPELDRFAEAAATFTRAYSTASWTLPAQASLLTATQPYQHGATRIESSLGGDLPTLAEHLSAAGWRTAAVTDSYLVSSAHGLDRGFEIFIESEGRDPDIDRSIERALEAIDRDDGRPFFLYLQTYRTHIPYLVDGE